MREIHVPSLSTRTTLRLGGSALAELYPENEEDLELLQERIHKIGGHPYPLGCGSNLLADDGELPIVLVNLKYYGGISITKVEAANIEIKVGAGTRLATLSRFCLEHGFSGLEGLVGIPGNVGGACAMNAGSFGGSIGQCLTALEVWKDGKISAIPAQSLDICYRSIKISGSTDLPLIVAANFTLTQACRSVMFEAMNHNLFKKKSRQPVCARTAGCTFKNPASGEPAGKLLEDAGFKGREIGGMEFSRLHANFLVNKGQGSSSAAHDLIDMAREEIFRRHGILLEPEIRFLSCHS